jgi:hypothetical protein
VDEVGSEEGVGLDLEEGTGNRVRMVEGTVDEVEDEGAMMVTTTMVVEVEVVDEDLVGREGSGAVDLIGVSHLPRPLSTRWEGAMKEK